MSKGQAGRIAGHHCTPGQGWRWQVFGGRMMLVTDGGGADVVLSMRDKGRGQLELITCGPDGVIEQIKPDTPMGRLLEAMAEIVDVARDIHASDDCPTYHPRLTAALTKAGVL